MQKTKEEILEKLEKNIRESSVGIELWFPSGDYKREVESGNKTFEEWFDEILERYS